MNTDVVQISSVTGKSLDASSDLLEAVQGAWYSPFDVDGMWLGKCSHGISWSSIAVQRAHSHLRHDKFNIFTSPSDDHYPHMITYLQ